MWRQANDEKANEKGSVNEFLKYDPASQKSERRFDSLAKLVNIKMLLISTIIHLNVFNTSN
jgi:hypothetical protein